MSTKTVLIVSGLVVTLAVAVQAAIPGLAITEGARSWVNFGLVLTLAAARFLEVALGEKTPTPPAA